MPRFLLPLLLVLVAVGCRVEPREAAPAEAAPTSKAPGPAPTPAFDQAAPGEKPEVVLYVTQWCPYCKQARAYMADEGIPHRVVDIEADAAGNQEYLARGGTGGIPLVAVGDEQIMGWSAEVARAMLDDAGYD